MKNLTKLLTMLGVYGALAQMPSPDAAQMAANVNASVNLYNGVSTISVPLYTVKANNGGGLPIGLQYTASGIKVGQEASSVGLGWQLMAGGAITRIVKGEPDITTTRADTDGEPDYDLYESLYMGDDGAADIFFYSYPGGSGKFILKDVSGDDVEHSQSYSYLPIPIPLKDISIEWKNYNTQDGFVIKDGFGNRFHFGSSAASREITYYNTTTTTSYPSSSEINYVSTWHLDKIEFVDQPTTRGISITYTSGSQLTDETIQYSRTAYTDCGQDELFFNAEKQSKSRTQIVPKYISKITFPKGYVDFQYSSSPREDLPGAKVLEAIIVKTSAYEVVKHYEFKTSYFNSGDSFFKNDKYSDINGACTGAECKRLKLDEILQHGKGQSMTYRTFDYANDKDFDATYGFDKYELPPKDSYYTDHWGYYSGGTHHGTDYTYWTNTSLEGHEATFTYSDGLDRASKLSAIANSLVKVSYPGGGYTVFEYSNHDLGSYTAGGIRIDAKHAYNESATLSSSVSYTYSSPERYTDQVTYYVHTDHQVINCGTSYKAIDYFTLHASALSPLLDVDGSNIGYSLVREVNNLSNGYVDHHYLNFTERRDNYPDDYMYTIDVPNSSGDVTPITNRPPLSGRALEYFDRGAEYMTQYFDASDNKLLQIEHFFEGATEVVSTSKNYEISDPENVGNWNFQFTVSEYDILYRPVELVKTIRTEFGENGEDMVMITDYSYHDTYKSLTSSVITTNQEGLKSKVEFRYPGDILSSASTGGDELTGLSQLLFTYYGVAVPVETIGSLQTVGSTGYEITGANYKSFYHYGSFVSPYKSYTLDLSDLASSYTPVYKSGSSLILAGLREVSHRVYDASKGTLTSSTGSSGVITTYAYDNPGHYLLSTTVNSDVQTEYTYIPLVGLSTVVDINDKVTTYEYDAFNRLRIVKDHNGHIVKRHRYHYAGPNEELGSAIAITGLPKANESELTFTSNHVASFYGKTRHVWDFGDGEVEEGTDHNISHTYSTAGNKTVKLTMINPEYEPIQVETSVSIKNNWYSPVVCFTYFRYDQCTDTYDLEGTCDPPESENPIGNVSIAYIFDGNPPGAYCFGSLTYQWAYKLANQTHWNNFSTNTGTVVPTAVLDVVGTHSIRCTITDSCDNSYSGTGSFTVIDSNNNCGGGSQPGQQ